MSEYERCQHTKDDGSQCGTAFGLSDAGLCFAHDPERATERKAAKVAGAKAVQAKARRSKGLDPEELPPLTSFESAEIWTDVVGRAAATGRIGSAAANAALRACKEWREARDGGLVSDRLDQLTAALSEWRETGNPDPVFELVEGGKS